MISAMMKLASSLLVRRVCHRQAHFFHSKVEQSSFLPSKIFSVVKIFTTNRTTNASHPWGAPISEECTGSGFVISDRRIITNAHVVTGSTFVQVTKLSSGTKYKAKILAFGHDCDLAILIIKDDDFWKDLEPLKFLKTMANLFQNVCIVGYPKGGDSICITRGIVSRITTQVYSHSKMDLQLPTLQVDAAINNGNSGGPVFVGNEVVGVAFQALVGGDNIGYVIPSPIVELFLAGIEKEEVGFCSLGISIQAMENDMMRDYFRMTKKMTGVLVTALSEARYDRIITLKKNDVILEVDGIPIEDDGTVFFENRFWIHLDGFIALKKPKERVSFKVLRKGNVKDIDMVLKPVVDWSTTDHPSPSYYIFAGFVFTESSCGDVMISQVLEHNINRGYTSFDDLEVCRVNGRDVYTLEGLCEAIVGATTDYVKIDLQDNLVVMVNLETARKCHRQLLDRHKIIDGMSENLQAFNVEED